MLPKQQRLNSPLCLFVISKEIPSCSQRANTAWNAENPSKACLGWHSCKHGQQLQFSDFWLLLEAAMICYLQHKLWTSKLTLNVSFLKIFREKIDIFLVSDHIYSCQIKVLTSVMTRGNSKHKNFYLLTTSPYYFKVCLYCFSHPALCIFFPSPGRCPEVLQLHTAFLAEVMYLITIPSMSKCQHLEFTWLTQTKTSLLWFKTLRMLQLQKTYIKFQLMKYSTCSLRNGKSRRKASSSIWRRDYSWGTWERQTHYKKMPNGKKTLNFTEQYNILSWKSPTRISKSSSWPYTGQTQQSHQMAQTVVQMLLQLFKAWCCDHCPGKPVQCSVTLWVKNFFLICNLNLLKLSQKCLDLSFNRSVQVKTKP